MCGGDSSVGSAPRPFARRRLSAVTTESRSRHMATRDIAAALVIGALGASTASAQGVEIDHKAVGCIVVGKYPKMNVCFTPAPNLARGRVYFRPEGTASWYYVDMKSDTP